MNSLLKATLTAFALAGAVLPATSQERPNTILVLDASGSMWGQIDGVNKIVIAREVVADILADFPEDQNLGFVTYGHRERGQCSDIQTVIEPAPGTAHEIIKIVNELNPRGMTPMTDAVIAAAQALRSTEQPATVILVSDGIETCNPDPCAAARALEEAGVDFTAHVIGFDVRGEAEALMQMQCIADETGGRFLTADNAAELSDALREVVAAPATGTFNFTAYQNPVRMGPEPVFFAPESTVAEPLVAGTVSWEISDNEYSFVETGTGNPFTLDLPFGEYVVTVTADAWDQPVQSEVMFAPDSIRNLAVMFPAAAPALAELTLRAVMDSENGPLVETPVTWTFAMDGDSFEFDGNPGVMELRAGSWTVTGYHVALEQQQSMELALSEGQALTQVMVFEVPGPEVVLIAPDSAPAATFLEVSWTGLPAARNDLVRIRPAGGSGAFSESRTNNGTSVTLLMPSTPGTYELTYEQKLGVPVATRLIEITPVDISIIAPESAVAGSEIEVSWTGLPPAQHDLVRLQGTDGTNGRAESYTRNNEAVRLRVPDQPGTYEITYRQGSLTNIVARHTLTVTPAE